MAGWAKYYIFFGDKEVLRQGKDSLAGEALETRADLQKRLEGGLQNIQKHLNKQAKKTIYMHEIITIETHKRETLVDITPQAENIVQNTDG